VTAPISPLQQLLRELYPRPGFWLIHLHARYRVRTGDLLDVTEYPPYLLVGEVIVRQPQDEGSFTLRLPDTTPLPLPPCGPWVKTRG